MKSSIVFTFALCALAPVAAQDSRPVDIEVRFQSVKDRLPGAPASFEDVAGSSYGKSLRALLEQEEGDRLQAGVSAMLLFTRFAEGDVEGVVALLVEEDREQMREVLPEAMKREASAFEGFEIISVKVYSALEAQQEWDEERVASLPEEAMVAEVLMVVATQDAPERKRLILNKTGEGWLIKN